MSISNSDPNSPCEPKPWPHEPEAKGIHVVLGFNVDLTLLRKQKRALIEMYEGATVNYEQEDAAEGLLNLIDFIQDSVLEQGLATEEEVFPQLPRLFTEGPEPAQTASTRRGEKRVPLTSSR